MQTSHDSSDALLNPASKSPGASAPSPASRRDATRARVMSLSQIAAALDRDRNTIGKWLEQGCPAVERADRATGKSWSLDVAEVVRWLERRSAESAAEKLGGGPDGAVPEAEAKRRRAVAQAIIAESEATEILRTMAHWSTIVDRVAVDYGELRSRLLGIGDAVAGRVERRVAGQVKRVVDEQVSTALASLKVDREIGPGDAE